jgi:hypothetical protein
VGMRSPRSPFDCSTTIARSIASLLRNKASGRRIPLDADAQFPSPMCSVRQAVRGACADIVVNIPEPAPDVERSPLPPTIRKHARRGPA